ncbi:hypothetical protein CSC33_2180 [Pseudomonas aeruginosa]|nr:hypothetical protein CSC33_2180 [Pseudomonas aeruginosa]
MPGVPVGITPSAFADCPLPAIQSAIVAVSQWTPTGALWLKL